MNCDVAFGFLTDRLKGLLSPEDARELDLHLASCPACQAEADALATVWAELGSLDDDVPHERMRARFHAGLAAFAERQRPTRLGSFMASLWPQQPAFQAGIALMLLIAGFIAGQFLPSGTNAEIEELRAEVRAVGLILLDHQSAAERLRGVEWARRATADARVVDALLTTVRYDPNLNVRLAAVDALSGSLANPGVGAGLTEAFEQQDAPLLQVMLAALLLDAEVAGADVAIERVLDREQLDPLVRDYLRSVLDESRGRALQPEA
jgi:anti-sigma factor RsiW